MVKSAHTMVAPGFLPPGGPMEIAFSFDTTGSMSSYLQGVRQHLQTIVTRLFGDIPTLRISIMAHGDYCDKANYVTKHVDLTNDVNKLTNFVKTVKSTGGGDWEECYELVLRQMQTHVNWAPNSQKALVMIGDAIPHEKNQNKQKIEWKKEVIALRDMGVRIYGVQCGGNERATPFWKHIADHTGGEHLELSNIESIVDLMMAVCYREADPDMLRAYEKEVRLRDGRHMATELGHLFGTLRGDDIMTSEDDDDAPAASMATPLPAGAGKKFAKSPRGKKTAVIKPVVKATTKRRSAAPTGPVRTPKRRPAAKLGRPRRKLSDDVARRLRESVTNGTFALADLDWSQWKLGMSSSAPAAASSDKIWQPRHGGHMGVRRPRVFDSEDIATPSVYEVAVQPHARAPKHPVSFFVTPGFRGRRWDRTMLREHAQEQADQVLQRGCKVYIRRAPLKTTDGGVKDSVKEMRGLLARSYDYAWKPRYDSSARAHRHRHLVRSKMVISDNI